MPGNCCKQYGDVGRCPSTLSTWLIFYMLCTGLDNNVKRDSLWFLGSVGGAISLSEITETENWIIKSECFIFIQNVREWKEEN